MSTTTSHAPGTFCWVELATTDLEDARRFYTSLFDWTTRDAPIPGGVYVMCQLRGHEAAALYRMPEDDQARGVPPHWFPYIAVANVDDTTARVTGLEGQVHANPFDVAEHGRMSVIQDPTGGFVGLWEAKRHAGVGVRDEPGALCWNELATRDRPHAAAFFGKLIGWELSSMAMPEGEYTVFMGEGEPKGGCLQITPEMGPVPTGWLTYFAVEDCEHAVGRVQELGGSVLLGPETAPGIGRWAMCRDSQGAVFSLIAPVT